MKIQKRLVLTCLAVAIGQALPLASGLGVAMADVVIDGDVSPPDIPPEGGLVIGPIIIGDSGQGSISLQNGDSVFTDGDVTFGAQAGSTGTGAFGLGTAFTSDTSIYVGYAGNGSLTLTEGATMFNNTYFGIGDQAGSVGNVTLDASSIQVGGELHIGNGGNGGLSLSNGSTATAGFISIADQAGSQGTVTLTGAGTTLNANGTGLYVGYGGGGSLNLGDGATATSSDFVGIGDQAGAVGMISLSGQGTSLTAGGNLYVGYAGTGTLDIGVGATATTNADLVVADQAGSIGQVKLDGPGTALNVDGAAYVGSSGEASLQLANGAGFTSSELLIGQNADGVGRVQLDGQNTTLTTGDISVGNSGNGSLAVSGGAVATSDGFMRIGSDAGAVGAVSVAGADSVLITNGLTVGNSGNATLELSDGASMLVQGGPNNVAGETGSTGRITLRGQSTLLDITTTLAVGRLGDATLEMSDGASLQVASAFSVGGFAGSSGTATLAGAGTSLMVGGPAFVGYADAATMSLSGGASFTAENQLTLGLQAGSQGTLALEGTDTALTTGAGGLVIGDAGKGLLTVGDSASLQSDGPIVLASQAGSEGTLALDGADTTLTTGAGGLVIGNAGKGLLSVGGNASLQSTGPIVVASQAGSVGELVIGSAAGTAPGAAGAVEAPAVDFGAGTGKITFNHTDSAYAFAPGFSGNGSIDHLAGTTFFNGDGAAFAGTTTVQGGSLYVNQALGGTIGVQSGATLGGSGSVGALTVASGGTVRPGAATSPGYQTLTVMGDYHAQAGSVHLAEINAAQPGQSDLLKVQGTATLDPGSVLNIQFANTAAGFTPGTRYTLLSADQGVTGTYTLSDSLPQLSAVLGLQAGYDGQSAYVDVTQVRSLPEVGSTPNEQAVLVAVQELPVTNPVYLTVINQPTDLAVRERAVELSGEAYASAQAAWIDHSRYLREAVTGRLRQGENGPGALRGSEDTPWSLWAHFVGAWGRLDGDNGTARVKSTVSGVMAGADRQIGEQGRIGLVAGSTHTSLKSSRMVRSSGDDVTFGLYGGAGMGAFKLRAGVADTRQKLDVDRQASLLDGSGFVTGQAKAHLGQAFVEVGYPIGSETKSIEPFAQVAYVRLRTDGFQEQGDTNALVVDDARHNTTLTTLGARGTWNGTLQGDAFSLHGALGWRHASGYVDPSSSLRFAEGTTNFVVNGVPLSRNAAVVDVGMLFQIRKNLTFDIAYNGQLASGSSDNAIKATAVWQF